MNNEQMATCCTGAFILGASIIALSFSAGANWERGRVLRSTSPIAQTAVPAQEFVMTSWYGGTMIGLDSDEKTIVTSNNEIGFRSDGVVVWRHSAIHLPLIQKREAESESISR